MSCLISPQRESDKVCSACYPQRNWIKNDRKARSDSLFVFRSLLLSFKNYNARQTKSIAWHKQKKYENEHVGWGKGASHIATQPPCDSPSNNVELQCMLVISVMKWKQKGSVADGWDGVWSVLSWGRKGWKVIKTIDF